MQICPLFQIMFLSGKSVQLKIFCGMFVIPILSKVLSQLMHQMVYMLGLYTVFFVCIVVWHNLAVKCWRHIELGQHCLLPDPMLTYYRPADTYTIFHFKRRWKIWIANPDYANLSFISNNVSFRKVSTTENILWNVCHPYFIKSFITINASNGVHARFVHCILCVYRTFQFLL